MFLRVILYLYGYKPAVNINKVTRNLQITVFSLCNRTSELEHTLISKFRPVLNALLCFLDNLPTSDLLLPMFRNLLAIPSS